MLKLPYGNALCGIMKIEMSIAVLLMLETSYYKYIRNKTAKKKNENKKTKQNKTPKAKTKISFPKNTARSQVIESSLKYQTPSGSKLKFKLEPII